MSKPHSRIIVSMIGVLLFSSTLCSASPLRIQYLTANEAKGELLIHGTFGNSQGNVTINNVPANVLSWMDTMIVCTLPDTGKGAEGPVTILLGSDSSNTVNLTGWYATLSYGEAIDQGHGFAECVWHTHWRADIESILAGRAPYTSIPFELAPDSYA